jgi:hypothetical protein
MNAIAKPIVKNKYWIVESGGAKIATIQAIEEGGFAYVHDELREKFPSIKLLSKKYNIIFDTVKTAKVKAGHDCYGYPCVGKPHNMVWDVQRRLPIYSKQPKSKSFYCAGYYLVKFNSTWIKEYSPKNITLNRYEFVGPFATAAEQIAKLKEII